MGDHAEHPPNTLSAYGQALTSGADMIEIDVSVTADGVAIATHGPGLEKWTTGRGKVHRTLWEDVAELRVLARKGGVPTDHFVPTLEAVLAQIGGQLPVNLDVKNRSALGPALAVLGGRRDFGVISGLASREARRVLRSDHDVSVLVNLSGLDKLIARSRWLRSRWLCRPSMRRLYANEQVVALNLNYGWVDEPLVARVHELGAQVWVFTVPDQASADAVAAIGVDSITADRPGEIVV